MFQSSPAPRRGRYGDAANPSATVKMFQSSPAPRRYYKIIVFAPNVQMFQSSPAPRRGRYRPFF